MNRRLLSLVAVLVLACPGACKRRSAGSTAPGTSSTTPTVPALPKAASQPPIRVNETLGKSSPGASVRVRLFVSTLTTEDPVRFAFQVVPVPSTGDTPSAREELDWGKSLESLVFELRAPSGAVRKLVVGQGFSHPVRMPLADAVEDLEVGAGGLVQFGQHLAWKDAPSRLLSETGKYSLVVSGTVATDKRSIQIASKPIELTVVAHDAAHRSLAEIERAAVAIIDAKAPQATPPEAVAPIIDDLNGNLWTRFELDVKHRTYDIQVAEVLVSPAGKELAYDRYVHFTCVAAGTSIAVPGGAVPVESLRVGDRVVSYDPGTRRFGTSVVQQLARETASRLYVLGRLRVTGNHPIFADGRFRPAAEVETGARLFGLDSALVPAKPRVIEEPAVVYDLSVTPPHTYFADGWLVHNKAALVRIGGNQPWQGWFYRRTARL